MAATLYIGTSGYSYTDWVGPFYPRQTKKSEYLIYYSSRFNIVELNFSYYRMPEERTLGRMVETTKEGFLFSIKAHKTMTHEVGADWRRVVQLYRKAISPLVESGRLGGILMQFPFSFHYTANNRRYLSALCTEMSQLPVVLEFRNAEWQRESVYSEMRGRNIAMAAADYPRLAGLPEAVSVTTADLGYVRFHGRNSANWWKGTNASRYDYLYSGDELDQWLDKINRMSRNTSILVLVFNNHWRGQAIRNAILLRELLRKTTDLEVR